MRWLPLIVICLLIYIEAVIFVNVASSIGVLTTLFLVVLTSCVGVSLVKNQGVKNIASMQQKLAVGEVPAAEMVKSVSLILAGILLLIPGFFTDFLGLLLLLPPLQALLVTKLISRIRVYSAGHTQGGFSSHQNGTTFEGEYQRKEDSPSNQLNNKGEDQNNDHFSDKK
ncbi:MULTISPECIES: FxsA family protein [Proteus]|uniref:Membrane protein FxsA (Suppressor of F exclusion of phage T7) n=1 Tax=Proteus vulgaris TaxID=585 RepID=A0A379FA65_PROVU|nr:FxsA family protein [Proteus vulgaris]MBI6511689.1 FxsA family protein [Proteus sp. PR00174]NBN44877.1 FxsA family protein [Proteus sp. G2626]NBN59207.1 FxsA family protein [Proteus sp. G2639]NBN74035.1 FxsA family protein [Proteus sp. G2615]NBN86184.1 FxsA family protein [Proteus sp. G2300]